MQKFSFLIPKAKQLGRWCQLGAWSILGLGLLSVALNAIYAWHAYVQAQDQFQNLFIDGQNPPNNLLAPNPFAALSPLATACQQAILPIFLFVVLYIAGTMFMALAASTAPTAQDTEDIVYEPLVPIKMRE